MRVYASLRTYFANMTANTYLNFMKNTYESITTSSKTISNPADGKYEYLKSRSGFVLAGMEGYKYKLNELQLNVGDKIFLYTDGVTEANNSNNELYGEERLNRFLNENYNIALSELLPSVKRSIDEFVGDAPQFDDITMLILEFKNGNKLYDEKTFSAKKSP